ncbi:hypothetical protein PIB30_009010 [Stylosanthes scabra]|uniref:Uncharacterized protein n=1 Tax=Stylosanthes scabra TaxID=79078 RepID=A0ABU6T501_9FABA|nr:hypothetical protein [Stylosanthes scabra]
MKCYSLITSTTFFGISPRTLPSASPRKEHFLSLILIVYSLSRLREGNNSPEPAHPTDGNCPTRTPREIDSRGRDRLRGNEAGGSHGHEAMKRAEAMATRQQALLDEAEKRDQELKEKLRNRLPYTD